MPAYLKGMGAVGAKTVTVYKDNQAKHGLPTILGTLLLLDEATGAPLALMDAGFLTGMRTGAVAGLATRLLAREDSRVHAIFGTGGMARAQAWAVDCVRKIDKLFLYSLDPADRRDEFAASLGDIIRCPIVQAEDPRQAVEEADIVTLITSAKDPVVQGGWFRPGTHINGIGSHAPAMRELDPATVARSKVVCDLVDACKAEAGDFILPAEAGEWSWDRVHGSLGDIVTGKIPGRESAEEITVFKSVGLAIQDVSTARHVYDKATERGVGTDFEFTA
jgi:ornithine cyclodeaminase/alanine dehydrogenase-like protein (mu-crystallin family)